MKGWVLMLVYLALWGVLVWLVRLFVNAPLMDDEGRMEKKP